MHFILNTLGNYEKLIKVRRLVLWYDCYIQKFFYSCGGNMLMNIGPTKEGKIIPVFEERLRQFGSWLKINGEGVYGSVPWSHQNDFITKNVWYCFIYCINLFKSIVELIKFLHLHVCVKFQY